jgi:predicted pyridoxine 5'-phosphate oxidase superfamily flavin-nucleotide-binding protein
MTDQNSWEKYMVALNAEMRETFSKVTVFPVSTASKSGIPNVALIAFVRLENEDTIWLGDNFMKKTLSNVKENPHVAISVFDPEARKCFQIKGTVSVRTSGPDYEKMQKIIHAKNPALPAKSLLVMKITEVYNCLWGPAAGNKIL